jgi:glutamine amidotransferase
VAPLVYGGSHALLRQSWAPQELLSGSVNADGWGVAWYAGGAPRRLAEVRPLWYEEELEATLQVVTSGCAVAALRNGTPGIAVDRSALLPIVRRGWCFVLNGYVPDFRRSHMRALRAGISDGLYGSLEGVSDSETLLLRALDAIGAGATPAEALARVVEDVLSRVDDEECQLTMTLTDGDAFVATRASNVQATNTLYWATGHPLAPGGTLLASERLDDDTGWRSVPERVVVEVGADGVVATRS